MESKTEEPNIRSIWRRGEDSRTIPLSANSNNNHMGRNSPSLNNLHNENGGLQGNGASTPGGISFQDMTIVLADKITIINTKSSHRPTTINVTASMKEEKIVKFMFSASVRTSQKINNLVAQSRVRAIPILQWCQSNVAQTGREYNRCNYPWGNCAETIEYKTSGIYSNLD
ncbi:hypothetical protein C2G38_2316941 [Gigaspora rosea]|uniref:Uncharacterized protein n=1 Tax=Gigaspora rosea TaxID=44941 RepID=A0A397V1P5_9GLOM|nr:hypothetical protein C2G38_2316941 [Gigaspora rosea]